MLIEYHSGIEQDVYEYWKRSRKQVPYYFDVSLEAWKQSMFEDRDYDGQLLFSELKTMVLYNEDNISGLIQFGLTNFILDRFGKNMREFYGIIRTFICDKNTSQADINAMLQSAHSYFDRHDITKPFAYFHFFGMSCYARQGKLHESEYHVEQHLLQAGYVVEHENVYYSKKLDSSTRDQDVSDITFLMKNNNLSESEKNHDIVNRNLAITFRHNNHEIGGCELYFVLASSICYLRWIFIKKEYASQGYGSKCMKKLCSEIQTKKFHQLHTNTADSNLVAQRYYIKHGFEDLGRMRSYMSK